VLNDKPKHYGLIDFHSIVFFNPMEVNGCYKHSLQSSFVFIRRNKFIQVWNKLRVS